MITPEANNVWAGTGAIVSPNKGVTTDKYPNDLVVREAKSLTEADQIRYDGSDLLPAGIQGEQMGALLQRAIAGERSTGRTSRLASRRPGLRVAESNVRRSE